MIPRLGEKRPHYVRLTSRTGDKKPPSERMPPRSGCGVSSAQWVQFDEARVYEILPDVLSRIHAKDRGAQVIIEADTDPMLRHAYPYDHRVFVLRGPERLAEVFRTGPQAAAAFQATLDDTAAFAREIYGLVEDGPDFDDGASERRDSLTATQLGRLFNTPLGEEIATRILLQPSHHGMIESDMIVLNTGAGSVTARVDECVRWLERILEHIGLPGRPPTSLFVCDPADGDDPERDRMYEKALGLLGEPTKSS